MNSAKKNQHNTPCSEFYLTQGLTEEEFNNLVDTTELTTIKDGKTLFQEGSLDRDLFILVSGKVRIEKNNSLGKKQLIRTIDQPKSILGEIAFVLREPRSATGIAEGEVNAIIFYSNRYDALLKKNNLLAYKLGTNILIFLAKKQASWNYDAMRLFSEIQKTEPSSHYCNNVKRKQEDFFQTFSS